MKTTTEHPLQAFLREGYESAGAANPHLKTSDAWEAFELGKRSRFRLGYRAITCKRGSTYTLEGAGKFKFSYANGGRCTITEQAS